jgi:hypothetical protein
MSWWNDDAEFLRTLADDHPDDAQRLRDIARDMDDAEPDAEFLDDLARKLTLWTAQRLVPTVEFAEEIAGQLRSVGLALRSARRYEPPTVPNVRSPGVEMIKAERARQITEKGYTAEHDDDHRPGDMALAAACYAAPAALFRRFDRPFGGSVKFADAWPWGVNADKRDQHTYLCRLVIAGALIAAEIDRIGRATLQKEDDDDEAN